MHLLDLFESTNEAYRILPNYDQERYSERPGLEGPMRARNGKVVYYDTKEGQYYDPDTDMYISNDEWDMMNQEHVPFGDIGNNKLAEMFEETYGQPLFDDNGEVASNQKTQRILNLMRAKHPQAKNDLEALLLSFENGQRQDRQDINTLYSQNREEDREIEQLEKELEALKKRRGMNEDYYETDEQRELARLGRILKDMGQKRDDKVGEAMGFLGTQLTRYGTPQGVNSIEKLEQVTGLPESVIMKMMALAQKVQGDVAVGDDVPDEEEVEEGYKKDYLTREKERIGRASDERDVGTNNYEVKVDGKPWKVFRNKSSANQAASTIQMRYGKKTEVYATRKPVSEGIAEDFDTNFQKRVAATVKGGKGAEYMKRKAKERQAQNKELDPAADRKGLGIGVLDAEKAREKMAKRGITPPRAGFRTSPNTHNPNRLPEDELSEAPGGRRGGAMAMRGNRFATAKDTDLKGRRYPGYTKLQFVGKTNAAGGEVETYTADNQGKRVTINIQNSKIIDQAVNEALDHDIKIGDTVETKKMGQMQGVVTGFSTKYGDTRVMFKHKSGKVYATPASNLKVIDTVKKTESQVAENIDLRHNLQPGTYKHKLQNIQVSIDDNGSVTFMQPAQWEIEGDQEYLEYVESQLAMPEYWEAELEEAKKKPVPTKPDKWAYAKAQAKKKFDVYPSAYANAWAAKKYKELGGGWRMGKPKK